MINDSNLFLHLNILRDNLIPLRGVFHTNYFKNSDLLYDITPVYTIEVMSLRAEEFIASCKSYRMLNFTCIKGFT